MRVAKSDVVLYCLERVGFARQKVRHVEAGKAIVEVDHVLLASVDVRHAHVVDVVADEIAGCLCRRR
eukprot:4171885-Pleurochrysis_carterae.AAC.1